MDAKTLTVEQCETFEDELTQKAVDYANLIKTPNQRALAAKDVITGLPDKEISLAYCDGHRAQLNELGTEMAKQIFNLRTECQARHTEYADNNAKDLAAVKTGVSNLEKLLDGTELRIRACAVAAKDVQQKLYDHIQNGSADSRPYAERLRQNERDVGDLRERKASKASVWFLAAATLLQSAYIGVELSRNQDTYVNKAYHAVKNLLGQ